MPRRVVSLLPSTTEIVAALGHGHALVGRSHECDFPPEVAELPVVSRPRREPIGSAGEISRDVTELLQQVLSIYEVDPAALRTVQPDLILTQDLCRVCAVAEDEVVAAARAHLDGEVAVLTSSPFSLEQVLLEVRRIGAALGDPHAGERLSARMQAQWRALAAAVAGRDRPRLALLEWTDPLMAGGGWAPELVEVGGADPVLGARGAHSPVLAPEALIDCDPDVILVAPCGFDLARAVGERTVLAAIPGWRRLAAVRAGRVAFADGSAYFNRPGPRLVDSAAIVAAVAHGIGPAMALQGRAWQRWERWD